MSHRRWALVPAVVLGVGALALPSGAAARTKTVIVGQFGKAPKGLKVHADANAFFRKVITIHKGDRVRWKFHGFHTVTFAPPKARPGLITPGAPVSGVNDAAGNPFWFSAAGLPSLNFNPAVVAPQGGKRFKPGTLQGSGLPMGPKTKPYTLRFTHKGTFDYFCAVHPGMDGKVRVVGRRHHIPSKRRDRRVAKHQLHKVVKQALRLQSGRGTPTGDIVQAGNDRRDGATLYAFYPAVKTIKVGTTLTFRMAPQSTETHTFTFGPEDYLKPMEESFESPSLDQRGVYPSESPQAGVPDYDGTNHGNGFLNTGALDTDPHSPIPSSYKVRFTKAGTFDYLCLIHPDMKGQIKVVP